EEPTRAADGMPANAPRSEANQRARRSFLLPSPEGTARLLSWVLLTVRVKVCRIKLAVTARVPLMVTVQVVPETASQPLQPAKSEPKPGVAVRVTAVPLS